MVANGDFALVLLAVDRVARAGPSSQRAPLSETPETVRGTYASARRDTGSERARDSCQQKYRLRDAVQGLSDPRIHAAGVYKTAERATSSPLLGTLRSRLEACRETCRVERWTSRVGAPATLAAWPQTDSTIELGALRMPVAPGTRARAAPCSQMRLPRSARSRLPGDPPIDGCLRGQIRRHVRAPLPRALHEMRQMLQV
jgi:hypothetical protein